MATIIGFALICSALLVLRVSAVGARMNPAPWWASDNMTGYASVPFCVAAMAGGAASLLSWLNYYSFEINCSCSILLWFKVHLSLC